MDERLEARRRVALTAPDDHEALRQLARDLARSGDLAGAYRALLDGGLPPEDPQAIELGRILARKESPAFRRRHARDTRFALASENGEWLWQGQEQHRRLLQPTRAIRRRKRAAPKTLLRKRDCLPFLDEIELDDLGLSEHDIDELAAGPPLRSLRLHRVSMAHRSALARLAPLKLRALSLGAMGFYDDEFHILERFSELRSLSLSVGSFEVSELQPHLASLPLTALSLSHYLDPEDLTAIAALSGLRSLELNNFHLEGALSRLTSLPLETLRLSWRSRRGLDLTPLKRLANLSSLSLEFGRARPPLDALPELRTLEELELGYAAIESPVVEWLGHLPRLRRLSLNHTYGVVCRDLPLVLSQLADPEKLLSLNLAWSSDPKRDLSCLSRFSSLRCLDLSRTEINGSGLAALSTLPKLRELRLHSTGLHDKDLAHLRSFPKLQSLDLSGCWQLTKESVPILGALPHLRRLNLTHSGVSAAIAEVELAHIPLLILQQ